MINHEEQNPNSNPAQNFIGRSDIFEKISDILSSHETNSVVLYGAPCMGKTSTLKELLRRLPEVGKYHPLYYNLKDKSVESPEVEGIGLDRSLLENFSVNTISASFLEELSDPLSPGTSIVMLFDEFDSLAGNKAFSRLKEVMKYDREMIRFIFAVDGDSNEEICTLAENVKSCYLSCLNRKETEQLVQSANCSLSWNQGTLDRIWDMTDGHPYLIKHLCSVIVNEAKQEAVDSADIDAAIPSVLENADNYAMRRIWNNLSNSGREIKLLTLWFKQLTPDRIWFKQLTPDRIWFNIFLIVTVFLLIVLAIVYHPSEPERPKTVKNSETEKPVKPPKNMIDMGDYFIDIYEVDIASYRRHTSGGEDNIPSEIDEKMPITNITWKEAKQYADKIKKRLCTKDEWIRAYKFENEEKARSAAIVGGEHDYYKSVYAEDDISYYKVCNMIGNVREWVDFEGKHYYIGLSYADVYSFNITEEAKQAHEMSIYGANNELTGVRLCEDK